MHTLSIFPDLLTFGILAPFILRVIVGIIFIDLGRLMCTSEKRSWSQLFTLIRLKPTRVWIKIIGNIQIIGGLLLILGLYTQLSALILGIIVAAELFLEKRDSTLVRRNIVFYILLLTILISLLLTGAGILAIDLPL